jgi:hypothetical protein
VQPQLGSKAFSTQFHVKIVHFLMSSMNKLPPGSLAASVLIGIASGYYIFKPLILEKQEQLATEEMEQLARVKSRLDKDPHLLDKLEAQKIKNAKS